MRRLLLIGLALVLVAGCGRTKKNRTAQETPSGPGTQAPGSGGTVQAVRGAVQRTVTFNDMDQIRLFIDTASGASGQMPTVEVIRGELKTAAPKLYALIEEGAIVLTGVRSREGIWAYTKEPQHGGEHLVITSSAIERMAPAALEQRLRQQQGQ